MNIEYVDIDELVPYVNNPKEHPEEQLKKIASSIREFGFNVPCLARSDMSLVAGHGRLEAVEKYLVGQLDELLEELDEETMRYETLKHVNEGEIPTIISDDMTESQARAFRIADNKVAESSWDYSLLHVEIEELDAELKELDGETFELEDLGFEEEELADIRDAFGEEKDDDSEDLYTQKIDPPTYEPTGEKPSIDELYDDEKTKELKKKIEQSEVDGELEDFLKIASNRHTVLNYEKIAEFYAHAPPEVQELFEDNYLVIIDIEKAIEEGLTEFTKEVLDGVEY